MNPLLERELAEVLHDEPTALVQPASERSLRVAAATVADARPGQICATRVVGILGRDDLAAFQALVHCLADEFELDASVSFRGGSFSVRFSRPTSDP
jgi:hypothetical protein